AINVERLYSKADRQHRQVSRFGGSEQHHIRLVPAWNNRAQVRLGFSPVAKRIDVVNRAGQANVIGVRDDRFNIVGLWNQRQKHGRATGGIDRFGIGLAQLVVKSIPVVSARYAYDRSVVSAQLDALSI